MFIDVTAERAAAGATAEYFAGQRHAWGFLPNYAQCFATRPEVAIAWSDLAATVRASMDRRRFELVTLAAALGRRSTYCAVAHATMLIDLCKDEATVQAVASDPTGGGLPEPDRSIFAFASKVARAASEVEQDDIDSLRGQGLTDAEIADIAHAVGLRAFFTTVLDALGARLDAATAAALDPEILAALTVGREPDQPARAAR